MTLPLKNFPKSSFLLVAALAGCVTLSDSRIAQDESGAVAGIKSDCTTAAVPSSFATAPKEPLDPKSLRLLSWNIYKESRDGWMGDFRALTANADVVALQEAALEPRLEQLLRERGYAWNISTAFMKDKTPIGVLTAGAAAPTHDCSISALEPLLQIPKQIMISRYGIAGRSDTLLVANVHSVNFTLGTRHFRAQLDGLRAILASHAGPIIVTGDFNTWNKRRQILVDDFAQQLNLETVRFADDRRSRFLGQTVDHVFYRGLTARGAATHPVVSSDHNPLTVDFSIDTPL